MKKYTIILLLLLLTLQLFSRDETSDLLFNDAVIKILDEMEVMVNDCENNNVKEVFLHFKNQANANKVVIFVNENSEMDIFGGIGFNYSKNDDLCPEIVVFDRIDEMYEIYPSIVMSALIHEMKHYYDYYNSYRLFIVSDENVLEKYLFEMDALFVEALFVKHCLKPAGYTLTDFENALLHSLETDNLAAFSTLFKAVDMKVVYKMMKYSYDNSLEDTLSYFTKTGKAILDSWPEEPPEEDRDLYLYLVPLYTYAVYIPQMSYDLYVNKTKKNILPEKFNFKKYCRSVYKMHKKIQKIYLPYSDFFMDYRNYVLNEFCPILN